MDPASVGSERCLYRWTGDLAPQDVDGSLVWAAALHQAGVLSADEYNQISAGLKIIQAELIGKQDLPSGLRTKTSIQRWNVD